MSVQNYSDIIKRSVGGGLTIRQNQKYTLQHPARALLVGPSGSGKTNVALNLILGAPDIRMHWNKLYICAKDLEEEIYVYIRQSVQAMEDKIREEYEVDDSFSLLHECSSIDALPSPDDLDPQLMHLFVIDDMITTKDQKVAEEHYVRGRKRNASYLYLSQSWYDTPKLIRKNINYALIWKLTGRNDLVNVTKDVGGGMPAETIRSMFEAATQEPYNFFMVDLKSADPRLRFRKNFLSGAILS